METTDNTVIRLDGVTQIFDRRTVLSDASLSVRKGDFIAITGPNGGGKTTLLRIILKLLIPTSGTVTYFENDGTPCQRLPIGYLPQKNMIDARFPLSVTDVIASGLLGIKGLDKSERRRRIDEMIERVDLRPHARQAIGHLSGGQLQRALLGRALVSRPDVLVLDEPLSYIDKRFEHRIYQIIESLRQNVTILLVSHEMTTIAGMANRHLIVDAGIHECSAAHHMVHYDCCN